MVSTSPPDPPASQESIVTESDLGEPLSQQSTSSKLDVATLTATSPPPTSRGKRAKFASPAPFGYSFTPPPSSQIAPPPRRTLQRASSSATSQLSSPPPTIKPMDAQVASDQTPTADDIDALPTADLRVLAKNLSGSLRESRTTAAHYKLQYNMLCLDSSEISNRMAVELAMVQREVDVLQEAEERRREESTSPQQAQKSSAATVALVDEMTQQCTVLRNENVELRELLNQERKQCEGFETRTASLQEENDRLRTRIKKNREHINGLLDSMKDHPTSFSVSTTPHDHRSTPRNHPRHSTPLRPSQGQPFEALLLADKMLSQETTTTTAPSTPHRRPPAHHRASQSLSSLPSPRRAPLPLLHTPPNPSFRPVSLAPQSAPERAYRRRAGSSDSTISASSDCIAGATDGDEVPESQASRAATSMLRRTPVQSFSRSAKLPGVSGSAVAFPSEPHPASGLGSRTSVSQPLVQAKLFGHVKKPRGDGGYGGKRKFYDSVHEAAEGASKRSRGDGVGLGIGLARTPQV
ncbi:hypothetical protein P152DRAFT_512122 [Eremomyces bilateralis CBS 781.70]|uniref:Uncharacterized protein n=1 Tax=Eremomyces bilateralis CBS 781.70 TaxID=1392243 RepID=A0A6G1G9R4_9PEZI|nr:uncharacterized protein P152DRAFT_512122 [Eremomyces bilateralis CBS 781.70]KAF1814764.1 hypothetical protein P152DRAFT_512122 [Eremomyces bilateralis CBS 781.70]